MKALPFVVLAMAAALTACASVPARNDALDLAHSRFTAAQTDPQVARLAPEEMKRASEALRCRRPRVDREGFDDRDRSPRIHRRPACNDRAGDGC